MTLRQTKFLSTHKELIANDNIKLDFIYDTINKILNSWIFIENIIVTYFLTVYFTQKILQTFLQLQNINKQPHANVKII